MTGGKFTASRLFPTSVFRAKWGTAILVISTVFSCTASYAQPVEEPTSDIFEFNIPRSAADKALIEFAVQANLTLVFPFDETSRVISNPLVGEYKVIEGLDILLAGTPLASVVEDERLSIVLTSENKKGNTMRKSFVSRMIAAITTGLFVGGATSAAIAADDTVDSKKRVIEEVIVTATKRDENLQDVAMSVSAITESSITREGLENSADFARRVPGLIFNSASNNLVSNFVIRGIAVSSNPEFVNQPVAVYIDEIPITSSNSSVQPDLRLFDVERVEVLKGPQGTLFGEGSLGGVVRVVTNKPDVYEFDSSLSTDMGSSKGGSLRQRYNGMVNVPLIQDKLALRVVGYLRDEEGYVDNIGTGKDNADTVKAQGARIALRWEATDRFSASMTYLYQNSEPEDIALFSPALGTHVRDSFVADGADARIDNMNLTLKYDFEFAQLISSSNFANVETVQQNDLSSILGGLFPWGLDKAADEDNFVQEIRLVSTTSSKLQWIVGAFYLDRETSVNAIHYTTQAYLDANGISGLQSARFQDQDYLDTTEERSLFGEMSYDITDRVKATMGVRRTRLEATRTQFAGGVNGIGGFIGAVFGGITNVVLPAYTLSKRGTSEQTKTTTKWSLAWEPTDNINLYALASEGFRGGRTNDSSNGGVSLVDPTDIVIQAVADSDSLWNYEIGMKSIWADGSVSTNISAYYIPWEDIQLQGQRLSDGRPFVTNLGKAVSKGIEMELLAYPSNNLELGLNLTVSSAEITELTAREAGTTGAIKGSELSFPDFQASGFAQYTFPTKGGNEVYVRADVQYMGEYINGFPFAAGQPGVPYANTEETDSYENVNLSVGWVSPKWTVALYGENMFNNDDITYVYPQTFLDDRYSTLRPRTIGLRVTLR